MYWRTDPRAPGGPKSQSDSNWPKNGALLTGTTIDVDGEKFLEVTRFQQAGSHEAVAVTGKYMLHNQGGQILFPVDDEQ